MREDRAGNQQPAARARFVTTHWSMIQQARGSDAEQARRGLEKLIGVYWYPMYAFARRKGHSDHDSMDLTQGYFAHLLSGDGLDLVSRDKGRFRSFLLASFSNFIANQRRMANAQRRGGLVHALALNSSDFKTRYDLEPADDQTPEVIFQRNWVNSLLETVRKRLAAEYQTAGKSEIFALLEPHMIHAVDPIPRAQISEQLKLSPAAVAMSLHRMRRRYGELVREEIAATVSDPAEVEEELHELMASVGKSA